MGSDKVYGIPPEQVVGTASAAKYGYDKDGKPTLTKESKLTLFDDFGGKPEGIHLMIGRRPYASFDRFSLNPTTCAVNWRTHENYPPSFLPTNRGAAYMVGMLFRGTQDGRMLTDDFKSGKRTWETTIADARLGESPSASPLMRASDFAETISRTAPGTSIYLNTSRNGEAVPVTLILGFTPCRASG
jgi:hypothetical protein